jgi:nicotinamidase-related amidase
MNTAFLGLDYIVDIMHPSGKIAASAEQAAQRNVVGHANRLLAHARAQGWLSILVKVGFARGYPDHPAGSAMFGRAREFGALEEGSPGMAFHPDLQSELADLVIVKPRVSPFYGTSLDAALRARRIERLVIGGVSSAWAVQAAVRDAHDRDYQVVIVEDACAAASVAEHAESMALLQRIARIETVDTLLAG